MEPIDTFDQGTAEMVADEGAAPAMTLEDLAARLDAMQMQIDSMQEQLAPTDAKGEEQAEADAGEAEADAELETTPAPGQNDSRGDDDDTKSMRKKMLMKSMQKA